MKLNMDSKAKNKLALPPGRPVLQAGMCVSVSGSSLTHELSETAF